MSAKTPDFVWVPDQNPSLYPQESLCKISWQKVHNVTEIVHGWSTLHRHIGTLQVNICKIFEILFFKSQVMLDYELVFENDKTKKICDSNQN